MLIKHPSIRVASVTDIDSRVLDELESDLRAWIDNSVLKNFITDFEIMGSYARGVAKIASDLDINMATGTQEKFLAARLQVKNNREAYQQTTLDRKKLWDKWGTIIQLAMKFPTAKTITDEMSFSLKKRVLSGTNREKAPKLMLTVVDKETGEARPMKISDDPHLNELAKWKKLYGSKFLEFGKTPETAWMLNVNANIASE